MTMHADLRNEQCHQRNDNQAPMRGRWNRLMFDAVRYAVVIAVNPIILAGTAVHAVRHAIRIRIHFTDAAPANSRYYL